MERIIMLGAHEVNVYPQRHAYLTNRTTKFVRGIMESGTQGGSDVQIEDPQQMLSWLGDHAYDALCVAIPTYEAKCPKHEFMGYVSQEAWEKGEYNEDADTSPTFPEIEQAFKVAVEVNRFDILKILGQVFDLKLLKLEVNRQLARALSKRSQSSPAPEDGVETSTTSGTTDPTWDAEGTVSPGNDSSTSPEGTDSGTSES